MSNESKKKILIIEDESDVVAYLQTFLEDNGFETVTAFNGQEGLEKAASERPDLVTLDISMPEKSGIGFFRDLKLNPALASIPVVVVTAVTGLGGDPEPFKKFLSSRKDIKPPEAFLSKPIDRPLLLQTIKGILK